MEEESTLVPESPVLRTIRGLLLALVFIGIIGTTVELILLRHLADLPQLSPLLLLVVGLVVAIWQVAAPGVASVRMLQFVMLLFLSSGLVGIGYHYAGNEISAREADPAVAGSALFRVSLGGTSPVLAPGSLVLLGLVGLTYTHRHPLLAGRGIGL